MSLNTISNRTDDRQQQQQQQQKTAKTKKQEIYVFFLNDVLRLYRPQGVFFLFQRF